MNFSNKHLLRCNTTHTTYAKLQICVFVVHSCYNTTFKIYRVLSKVLNCSQCSEIYRFFAQNIQQVLIYHCFQQISPNVCVWLNSEQFTWCRPSTSQCTWTFTHPWYLHFLWKRTIVHSVSCLRLCTIKARRSSTFHIPCHYLSDVLELPAQLQLKITSGFVTNKYSA